MGQLRPHQRGALTITRYLKLTQRMNHLAQAWLWWRRGHGTHVHARARTRGAGHGLDPGPQAYPQRLPQPVPLQSQQPATHKRLRSRTAATLMLLLQRCVVLLRLPGRVVIRHPHNPRHGQQCNQHHRADQGRGHGTPVAVLVQERLLVVQPMVRPDMGCESHSTAAHTHTSARRGVGNGRHVPPWTRANAA